MGELCLNFWLTVLGCQYRFLTEGHISERLQSKRNILLLLQFLATELQSARMIAVKKPAANSSMGIKLVSFLHQILAQQSYYLSLPFHFSLQQETATASELKSMLIALKFPKPPDNIQPSQLFVKVEQRVRSLVFMSLYVFFALVMFVCVSFNILYFS